MTPALTKLSLLLSHFALAVMLHVACVRIVFLRQKEPKRRFLALVPVGGQILAYQSGAKMIAIASSAAIITYGVMIVMFG